MTRGGTHSKRAVGALARLPEVDPAIAALSLWCQYRDGPGPTITQGETILVGPEFPLLPISEQVGVIAHHVLHVALRHSARRGAAQARFDQRFNAMLFDLACDAMVNEALLEAGHALPRPAVRAREIVALLPREDQPENVLAEWDSDQLYLVMARNSGAGRDKKDDPFEAYARAQAFAPDLAGAEPGETDAELWAGRVKQALEAGKNAGSGVGAVLVQFGDLPQAVVPWELRLRRLLAKNLSQAPQQTYRRPSRAWLARDADARRRKGRHPAFAPALRHVLDRPTIVVGLDTSSSITEDCLAMFASEVVTIIRRGGIDAQLLGFDTEVHSRTRLRSARDLLHLELRKDGGTDFGPVLAEAISFNPSLIVMFTDLDAPTEQNIDAKVLWVVPTQPRNLPGYGDILVIDTP